MLPSPIREHKTEIGLAAAAGGLGALAGGQVYKVTPDKMIRYVEEGGRKKAYITDKFINYAAKVSKKDLFNQIDPHTERSWIKQKLEIIGKNASKAKTNPKNGERWHFQKIYNLGIKYISNRGDVAKEDIGLAKRGANAIYYGRAVEKRNTQLACAAICATAALLIKKGIEKYKEYKAEGKNVKDFLPKINKD